MGDPLRTKKKNLSLRRGLPPATTFLIWSGPSLPRLPSYRHSLQTPLRLSVYTRLKTPFSRPETIGLMTRRKVTSVGHKFRYSVYSYRDSVPVYTVGDWWVGYRYPRIPSGTVYVTRTHKHNQFFFRTL